MKRFDWLFLVFVVVSAWAFYYYEMYRGAYLLLTVQLLWYATLVYLKDELEVLLLQRIDILEKYVAALQDYIYESNGVDLRND
jgi:hypothetical protein